MRKREGPAGNVVDLAAAAGRPVEDNDEARSDRECVLEELVKVYEDLNCLYDLDESLEEEAQSQAILAQTFPHVRKVLPVEKAEIWISDSESGVYRRSVHHDGLTASKPTAAVPRSNASDHLLRNMGTFVLRDGLEVESPVSLHVRELARGLGTPAVALPLKAKNTLLGVALFQLSSSDPLTSSQIKLLTAVGRKISLALHVHLLVKQMRADERLKRELEIARDIQRGMLPQSIPQKPEFELFAGCVTAAHVGGDYYDFFERGGELGILVADASGHSVSSALIGMGFRSSFRHFLQLGYDLDRLFAAVNDSLHEELRMTGSFLSAFCCMLSCASGRRALRYANAGHPRPFLYRQRTGYCVELEEAGILLGIFPGSRYEIGAIDLEPGDVLVCYTDGLTEAENQRQELFGRNRLEQAVRRYATKSAKQIYHCLLKDMYLFQDKQFNNDDVTLCILKVRESPAQGDGGTSDARE
jgi:serine phosphatase RsbU (regulator of sigma subunit)